MSIQISDSTSAVLVGYYNDKGVANVETITIPATGDITQADYVVLTNTAGDTLAVWFDVDEVRTAPSGAAYGAADATLMIPIATGDTSIQNATNTAVLLDADVWSDSMAIVDNLNGTIKLTTSIGVAATAADPHNADDTALGAITTTATTVGSATKLLREDSFIKGTFNIIADINNNILVFNSSASMDVGAKGKSSTAFKYGDITLPTSTSLLNLKTQVDAWNTVSGIVLNEDAKTSEMTGLNSVFTTTYPFVYHSAEVFFNELKMTLNVDYTEDGAAGEVTFLTITPDATLPTPDTLTFNYIKL